MPRSMTGFASGEGVLGEMRLVWRVKSVNHRFLDVAMRLPEGCDALELLAARRLKERFVRGHLECALSAGAEAPASRKLEVDEALLAAVMALEQRVRVHPDGVGRAPMGMDRLLGWPGMVRERRSGEILETEAGHEAVLALLDQTCDTLDRARAEEGRALVVVMKRLLEELAARVVEAVSAIPRVRHALETRLRERVAGFMGSGSGMDEGLARELAYLFNRIDIAEEADRLGVHIREMGALLDGEEPVGLRLDFLCQELNREANTLCSKAQDRELSRLGVEIKVMVEQLREQARNLE
ncbi:MAG: YicC family protein [Magnetococcales bacterium]|nr:YicC family protein [Magnetococcales bacterium]